MMTLDNLYTKLALGELSNLAMVTLAAEPNTISDAKKPAIVSFANDALNRLYVRFPLKTDSLFLMQSGNLTRYHLSSDYALSKQGSDTSHTYYIQDTVAEPFIDDIIKVLNVYDRHGRQVPLNKESDGRSVFTLQPTLLQIPHPSDGEPLAVEYQARHPVLSISGIQGIELPDFLAEALTSFIASKVFSSMNTEDDRSRGQELMAAFETICGDIVAEDLVTTGTASGASRFEHNGWR